MNKRISGLSILLLMLLSLSAANVGGQQRVRASLRDVKDRPTAPAFRLSNPAGKLVSLSDFRGRPVVVNLWATACGGCVQEIPDFVRLDGSYRDKGLSILGVSMDVMYEDLKSAREGWDRVRPFAETHEMKYAILLDDGSAEKGFRVTALPATYLIDRSGLLAATYVGVVDPTDLEANVKVLLSERR